MGIRERRVELYKKYGITFDHLYHNYILRKIPLERMKVRDNDTLDYYCTKTREIHANITRLINSHEDDYIARTCMADYEAMLGKNWETRIKKIEDEIAYYYSKFITTYNEVTAYEEDGKIREDTKVQLGIDAQVH